MLHVPICPRHVIWCRFLCVYFGFVSIFKDMFLECSFFGLNYLLNDLKSCLSPKWNLILTQHILILCEITTITLIIIVTISLVIIGIIVITILTHFSPNKSKYSVTNQLNSEGHIIYYNVLDKINDLAHTQNQIHSQKCYIHIIYTLFVIIPIHILKILT